MADRAGAPRGGAYRYVRRSPSACLVPLPTHRLCLTGCRAGRERAATPLWSRRPAGCSTWSLYVQRSPDHRRNRIHGVIVRAHSHAVSMCAAYILTQSATHNIETICDQIVQSELLAHEGALRVGLIAYRDHPPQDHVCIVKNCTARHSHSRFHHERIRNEREPQLALCGRRRRRAGSSDRRTQGGMRFGACAHTYAGLAAGCSENGHPRDRRSPARYRRVRRWVSVWLAGQRGPHCAGPLDVGARNPALCRCV